MANVWKGGGIKLILRGEIYFKSQSANGILLLSLKIKFLKNGSACIVIIFHPAHGMKGQ